MVDEVMRRLRTFEELVKARLEADVAGLCAGVRARLEARLLLEPIPVAADLADCRGPLGWGPAFTLGLASGAGLHARVSPRVIDDAFAALTAALGRALDLVGAATEGPGGADAQQRFFRAFHEHGPRHGPLGRLMGAAWAE